MRFRGFLRRLQAVLPRSDLPGARQPTPFGLNRYVLLLFYGLYGSFTAAVFFGWPAMAAVIMRNGGFSNLCPRDAATWKFINDLRETANKVYICDEQDAAVQKLYPLTGAFCCAMSACGGALLDWIGPRWTACFGQTLTIIGWLLLAFGGPNSTPYIVGMAFVGLGADAGFLPAMCVTRIFPGASGFVITFLGSASTASSAVPVVLLALMEKHGATLQQAALGYIGVGPCFAVVVALLLLPSNNFLVDTDTPSLPATEGTSKETQNKGTRHALEAVAVAEETNGYGSSCLKSSRQGLKRCFSGKRRLLPVAETSQKHGSPVADSSAPQGEEGKEETPKNSLVRNGGRSVSEVQHIESTPADRGEAFAAEKNTAPAVMRLQSQELLRVTAIGGHEGEKQEDKEQQQERQTDRRRGSGGPWVAIDLSGRSWPGGAESTSASADSAQGENGGAGDAAYKEEEEESREGIAAGGRGERGDTARRDEHGESHSGATRGKGTLLQMLESKAEKSRRSGFLHQALSRRYLLVVVYFVGVSWAGAFYQQAPRRMFSDQVVWVMELLQPFGSIPCIILGRLSDIFGILKIVTVINTFGLLMYALSLGKSDVCGYISVVCFTLYISLFTSQVFIYIEKTFSPVHFGKLIGITVLLGGLLSFVCNPLYEYVVVNRYKGDPVLVQAAMVVLMCVQYVWIACLYYLGKKNAYPHRDSPGLTGATRETTQSEIAAANKHVVVT